MLCRSTHPLGLKYRSDNLTTMYQIVKIVIYLRTSHCVLNIILIPLPTAIPGSNSRMVAATLPPHLHKGLTKKHRAVSLWLELHMSQENWQFSGKISSRDLQHTIIKLHPVDPHVLNFWREGKRMPGRCAQQYVCEYG